MTGTYIYRVGRTLWENRERWQAPGYERNDPVIRRGRGGKLWVVFYKWGKQPSWRMFYGM